MKRIVIIGSGNLAEALARAVAACPTLCLAQVFARNASRGAGVAAIGGTEWTDAPARLAEADLYLLAVSDCAVGPLAEALPFPADALVAHTAGSVPLDALPAKYARRAVVYPLQTFTKGRAVAFGRIPLFVEGSDASSLAEAEAFARQLSGCVLHADSAMRAELHLAGVFACNFVNHMYAAGQLFAKRAGLPFEVLKPLIAETAAKALEAADPAAVQTGPAVRGDLPTLQRHEKLLADEPLLKEIYETISRNIWEISRKT